jgi:putative ABC transport system permease protein
MSMEAIRQDVRYAMRGLRREPGFFVAAVLIIGLGIGANTAIFSVLNTLLFRPLRFQGAERLVWIENTGKDGGLSSRTSRVANYLDWRRLNRSFEDMAAYFAFFDYGTYNLIGSGEPERLVGAGVSQNFLDFLGVRPALGRNFADAECQWNGRPAVILTHGLWQRRFGGDPNIIGRALTLNDRPTTVAGVLPDGFDFSSVFTPGSRVDMIVPFPLTQETDRWGNTLAVLGRLKPGVTVQQAQNEFDVLCTQIRQSNRNRWEFGAKLTGLQQQLTGRFRRGLLTLLGAVGAVLLIACTNLSNLLLARASSRRKEIAIRSALGAGRTRLIRQMLTESLVLSGCGALVGLAIAFIAIRQLSMIRGVEIPLLRTVQFDGAALLFTVLAALATGLLFGLAPALHIAGTNESESLKDTGRGLSEGRSTAWTRGALVISEVALACVLLVCAGLLIRSFERVLAIDPGFRAEHAASWRIESGRRYDIPARQVAFYDRLVGKVEAVPGVESAGITDALPLSRDRSWGITPPGVTYPPGQFPVAHPRLVDWRYIQTMKIPLIAGRLFDAQDTAESRKVILINQKAAQRLWPGRDPIGQAVMCNGPRTVVGVVGNVRHQSLEQEGELEVYFPITQEGNGSVELVVRTRLAPEAMAPAIRAALRSVEPALPTTEFQPLDELVDRAVSPRRFLMLLLGTFAAAALILASIGIYGVVSYSVTQRTQEIGIRMALGASATQVQRHVMRQTLALVGGGVLLGLAGAFVAARLTASLLYGLKPGDPLTFAGTVGVLLAVAVTAGYFPALRASHVDPISALRAE